MKKLTAILLALASAIAARANTFTFTNTSSAIENLSHGTAYTWGLGGANLMNLEAALHSGQILTSATLTINNIYDWTTEPKDVLYVNILNRVAYGTAQYTYNSNPSTYDTVYGADYFYTHTGSANLRFDTVMNPDSLLVYTGPHNNTPNPGTWSDPYGGYSHRYTLNIGFTNANLGVLSSYLLADFGTARLPGLGFSPDCHYYDSGMCLTINTGPKVPDSGATMIMLGTGLLALCVAGMFVRRNQSKA